MYALRASACPSTCTRPKAGEMCSLPDTETCVCLGDQVLRGDVCVDPEDCGCINENGVHTEVK